MTQWFGAGRKQPAPILAAARISRPNSQTLVWEAAGTQAAAACSIAPRTYPLAIAQSCCSRETTAAAGKTSGIGRRGAGDTGRGSDPTAGAKPWSSAQGHTQ